MKRLTGYDEKGNVFSCEEERLLNASGLISKDDMYKVMMHLAEKLAEYEDLEEQGKLLKLPCAVGDTVYYADNEYYFTILPVKVDEISIMESSAILYKCLLFDGNGDVETQFDFDKDDFGKTVFLTREEAEAALKELRDKKG